MNDHDFAVLISKYPDDNNLHTEMRAYYNDPTTPKKDDVAFKKGLAYQLKSWIQWKIFLVIITLGIYAIYYLFTHKTSRNIFSTLHKVINNRNELLNPPVEKKPSKKESNSKDSYSEITEASRDSDPSSTSVEDTDNKKATGGPKEKSEKSKDAEKSANPNKEPQQKENDEESIIFPENIRHCFRLQNGHFVVQGFNNKVWIISESGEHIKDLATKKIEELELKINYQAGPKTIKTQTIGEGNLPAEIIHFAQLEDGSIVGAGESLENNKPMLFIWKEDKLVELALDTTGKIHSIDVFENQIICSTTTNGEEKPFIFKIEKKNEMYQSQKFNVSNATGAVSFAENSSQFVYIEQEGVTPKIFLKSINAEGELLNHHVADLVMPNPDTDGLGELVPMSRQHYIMRISDNSIISVGDKSATIWDVMSYLGTWGFDHQITHAACSPNKKCFAFADETGNIFILSAPLIPDERPKEFFSIDPIQQLFLSDEGEISVAVGIKSEDNIGSNPISHIKFYNKNEWQTDLNPTMMR